MSLLSLASAALLCPLAVAVLLAPPFVRRRGRLAAALSIAAASVSFASAALMMQRFLALADTRSYAEITETRWLPIAGDTLAAVGMRLDALSVTMLLVVTAVALAVQVFSWGYLHDEPPAAFGRYYACQSLFLFSMSLLVLAPNLLQAFLGWELVGASSFLLIGYWWRKASAARAALKAFWITRLADSGFIVALIVLWSKTGSFSWEAQLATAGAATAVAAMLFLAVMGKSAQFPLHVWLPDAMEGPTPVSALLHAATMVAAGVFLVVRAWPLFVQAPDVMVVMAHVGAITALVAGCLACVQTDIKKVLAYSTCSQLGFMFAALGSGSAFAGFFHLTTHAFFKSLLFLAAGSVIHAVHSNELSAMGGLFGRMKLTGAAFILGALALAGIPPLAGFFSKDSILEAAGHRGFPFVIGALLVSVLLTSFYMGRTVLLAFFGPPPPEAGHAHESPPSMLVPVLLLAVPAAALGFAAPRLAMLLGLEHEFHLGALGILALVLSLAGLGLAAATRRMPVPLASLLRLGLVDRAWQLGYRRAVLSVSRVSAWVDRYVIDALMNVVGWAVIEAGRRLRPLQTGRVADYAWMLLVAVAVLAAVGALR